MNHPTKKQMIANRKVLVLVAALILGVRMAPMAEAAALPGAFQDQKDKMAAGGVNVSALTTVVDVQLAYIEFRKAKLHESCAKSGMPVNKTIRDIEPGMVTMEVYCAIGMPDRNNQTKSAYGNRSQMVYRGGYVHTTNDVVTSISY